MTNKYNTVTALPAWGILKSHYSEIQNLHLRTLFADDVTRGERMVVEDVGIYFDYSNTVYLLKAPYGTLTHLTSGGLNWEKHLQYE